MKIIKIINHDAGLIPGTIHCVHTTRNNNISGLHYFDWAVDEDGNKTKPLQIDSTSYVDVVGGANSSNETFYNSALVQSMRDLADAFRSGQSIAPMKDYSEQEKDREMRDFFMQMKMMMQDQQSDRWDRQNQEAKEQADKLAKEIQITPYSDEQKLAHYLSKGISNKLKVVYKKVS